MSQKEIAELKVILGEMSTTIVHIQKDVTEIKADVKTHTTDLAAIDKDLSALKGSYSIIKYLVLTALVGVVITAVKAFVGL